jgi:hypothetical protein
MTFTFQTRLGEISPIRSIWAVFKLDIKVAQFLGKRFQLYTKVMYVLILTKLAMGHILDDLFHKRIRSP